MIDPKTKFDIPNHLYLIEIYQQTAQEVYIKKAGQVCVSEYLVSYTFNVCDERDMNVLYLMPTDSDVSDFSQSRFGPALEASPYLDSIVVPATGHGNKRGSDKVSLKRIKNSFIFLRGGNVARSGTKTIGAHRLKSIPVDALILDEVDEIPSAAIDLARERLGHSEIAEVRAASTPTYPEHGIDILWHDTDQREWLVPCQACNHWQQMTINHIVTDWDDLGRPVAWHHDDDGPYPACEKCGNKLNRMALGQWVQRYPGREIIGYHPTKLFSYIADMGNIIKKLQTTDESKRQECHNQDLGETYVPKGGQMTPDVLDDCRREYAHGPIVNNATFLGADIGNVLHAVIRGKRHPETGEWPQCWAGEVESFEELGRLMKRFNVERAVLDANPETHKAREFQAHFPRGVVWLAYYLDNSKYEDSIIFNEVETVVNMDRTRSLDEMYSRFYDFKNTLPANARDYKDYYNQLCAPVRILVEVKGGKGKVVARYIEASADHLAHAENYCMAAMLAPESPRSTGRSRSVDLRGIFD